jgi:hypothetical protein
MSEQQPQTTTEESGPRADSRAGARRLVIALTLVTCLAVGVVVGVLITGPNHDSGLKHSESRSLTDKERILLSDVDSGVTMMMPGITADGSYDVDDLIKLEEQARELRPVARAKGCAKFEDGNLVKDTIADLGETTDRWEQLTELNSILAGMSADMPKC